jgi:hypothetical protein
VQVTSPKSAEITGLQRDSSRASFVRHFTLDHHMAAQKMAIRIDAARRRTRQENGGDWRRLVESAVKPELTRKK